ncbi:MAG: cobalt transporter CbiM [Deltaproteobacteria bacterium]|nr:cobalt transporter CbiM [Deltaproteobacteria bacterium]
MHISEGVLNAPVLVAGFAATAAGLAVGIKKMDAHNMPKIAVLSASFFIASLIHVPIGPSSVHLVLNGLTGIILGWTAFPAIAVALAMQALMFQFGGITTLGINTVNMALPAVLCFYLFRRIVRTRSTRAVMAAGFFCGFLSIAVSALLVALSLACIDRAFLTPAKIILIAHLPVMVIEGIITAFCLVFLKRVKPELLEM